MRSTQEVNKIEFKHIGSGSRQACLSNGKHMHHMTLQQQEVGWNKIVRLTGLTNTMRALHRVWER